jgi:peptidoglycan/xylan/chitin deacetylase (PgdA/CDA1 family)
MKSTWFTYHGFYEHAPYKFLPRSATIYHIPVHAFTNQIEAIKQTGKKVITVNQFFTERSREDSFVLTFDDGWSGISGYAYPQLQAYGFNGTLFITRDFIGMPGFLEKKDLVELIAKGMDIGIHGTTHRLLSNCTLKEVTYEFSACKDYLEALVGKPVTIASLPGGALNNTVIAGAKMAGIKVLCTSIPGVNSERTKLFNLKRVTIRQSTNINNFHRYCNYGLKPEIAKWVLFEVARKVLGGKNYVLLRRWLMKETSKTGGLKIFDP